jgi:hypothetical protein
MLFPIGSWEAARGDRGSGLWDIGVDVMDLRSSGVQDLVRTYSKMLLR